MAEYLRRKCIFTYCEDGVKRKWWIHQVFIRFDLADS